MPRLITLTESGETMKAAGLKAIDTVVSSTAVLVKSKNPTNPVLVDLVASRIKGVIGAFNPPITQVHIPISFRGTKVCIMPVQH